VHRGPKLAAQTKNEVKCSLARVLSVLRVLEDLVMTENKRTPKQTLAVKDYFRSILRGISGALPDSPLHDSLLCSHAIAKSASWSLNF
jgi:hypothetical protein